MNEQCRADAIHDEVILIAKHSADFAMRVYAPHGSVGDYEIRSSIYQTLMSMHLIPPLIMEDLIRHTKEALEGL